MTSQISDRRNLGGAFSQMFELAPALDKESIELVHRIRHDVYCRDLGWEPIREDGLEIDAYDRHAIHCLLRRCNTGEPVGCTRLILASPDRPEAPLPFEDSCSEVIDRSLVDPSRLPRQEMAEVSRLAVASAYRQRKGEAGNPGSMSDEDFESRSGMPRFPFIPVSLYLGVAAIARHLDIEHVFVLTEPRLASHFSRIGFNIQAIGGTIEHRGTRMPSMMNTSKVLPNLRPMIRPLYEVIEASVEAAFQGHPDFAPSMRAPLN